MDTVIIASDNKNKIKEFRQMFGDKKVLSLADIGFSKTIEETGVTFLENSLIKAKTISNYLKEKGITATVLADDSGLCVNALNGAPGVISARYAGKHGDDAANRLLLLNNLKNVVDRSAYFCCVIVQYFSDGSYIYGEGRTYGKIAEKELGSNGFGYDSIFISDDLGISFGVASAEQKNDVSHRGRALKNLFEKTL